MQAMSTSDGCNGISVALFTDAPYTGGAERYLHLLARGIERLCGSPDHQGVVAEVEPYPLSLIHI